MNNYRSSDDCTPLRNTMARLSLDSPLLHSQQFNISRPVVDEESRDSGFGSPGSPLMFVDSYKPTTNLTSIKHRAPRRALFSSKRSRDEVEELEISDESNVHKRPKSLDEQNFTLHFLDILTAQSPTQQLDHLHEQLLDTMTQPSKRQLLDTLEPQSNSQHVDAMVLQCDSQNVDTMVLQSDVKHVDALVLQSDSQHVDALVIQCDSQHVDALVIQSNSQHVDALVLQCDSQPVDMMVSQCPALQLDKLERTDEVMTAVEILEQEEELIGDGSRRHLLPTTKGNKADLKYISPSTLFQLLEGKYDDVVSGFQIIDCRYPYEFNGGHIQGAKNIYTETDIKHLLTCNKGELTGRHVIVFHCEFSSERGPKMLRHLRAVDRKENCEVYPSLCYPEIYIMQGGYKAFYEHHVDKCQPMKYTPMLHKEHASDLRHFRSRSKSWTAGERQNKKSIRKFLL